MCVYKITQKHMDGLSPNLMEILLGRLSPDDTDMVQLMVSLTETEGQCVCERERKRK